MKWADRFEGGREHELNWVLIGLVGLSIEFWIVVTTALESLTESL